MQKKEFTYRKKDVVQTSIGIKRYNVFIDDEGKQVAIKHNKLLKCYVEYIGKLVYNEKYSLFLLHGACYGIMTNDVFIFTWASKIILEKDNKYHELNRSELKSPLTHSQIKTYCIKFLKKVK